MKKELQRVRKLRKIVADQMSSLREIDPWIADTEFGRMIAARLHEFDLKVAEIEFNIYVKESLESENRIYKSREEKQNGSDADGATE